MAREWARKPGKKWMLEKPRGHMFEEEEVVDGLRCCQANTTGCALMEDPDDIGWGGFNCPQGLEQPRRGSRPEKEGGCW